MSNSAVFVLIANDGRADQMIMASALLHARIDDIRGLRDSMGHDDINPTLADIERTHILFMNATFKPFAAFGFEYQVVRAVTGTPKWGQSLKYSIPQAGDFFADMGVRIACKAITPAAAATVDPAAGHTVVGPGGNVITDAAATAVFPLVRWCDYPGERAIEKASFTVNTNPLQEYTHNATAMWRKFELPPGKEIAYARLVGQEVPLEGYSSVRNLADRDDGNIIDGLGLTGSPARVHRQVRKIVNGLQTPKLKHAATSFWHKCNFWFNKDPRLMVPSVAIPYGQRFVELVFAPQASMCGAIGTDRAWDLTAPVVDGAPVPVELDLLTAGAIVTAATTAALDATNNGDITSADLYVNNVYVLPDIHDIYIHRIGFNLIRVTKEESKGIQTNSSAQLLNNLKWPIELLYFGVQPTAQATDLANWWRLAQQTRNTSFQPSVMPARTEGLVYTIGIGAFNSVGVDPTTWPQAVVTLTVRDGYALIPVANNSGGQASAATIRIKLGADGSITVPTGAISAGGQTYPDADTTLTIAGNATGTHAIPYHSKFAVAGFDHFRACTDTVSSVDFTLHGTKMYDAMPPSFFSDYMPATFGSGRVVSTEDCGSHAMFFGLYPGTYQPSGHINISRAREVYLATTPTVAGTLLVVATAINFLLISDGNAILRYTT